MCGEYHLIIVTQHACTRGNVVNRVLLSSSLVCEYKNCHIYELYIKLFEFLFLSFVLASN